MGQGSDPSGPGPSALTSVWRRLPPRSRQRLRRVIRPAIWGNLRRLEPISASFGFDRGTPVDRYYMRRFLRAEASAIRGVAGEVSESRYVDEFGGDRVTHVDVIDINQDNPRATLIADLAVPNSLEATRFDCLAVLQTLQYVTSPDVAIRTCLRALRPGGTLLLAVPALTAHDLNSRIEDDRWRFWPAGVASLLRTAAPDARRSVTGYGNLVATLALLHGLSAEELAHEELDHDDPRFPVLVCARVDVPDP